MRVRNSMLLAVLAVARLFRSISAHAESVVRYGISMADIPLTTGQPDRGAGAYQFTGYTIYDPLVSWEMDVSDRPGKLVPGLATEWKVDDTDKTKWRFALRKGVKFHDGSDFNADAVIWNLDKVLNDKAPQFDKRQSAQVKTRLPSVASYAKIDDFTVEITTKTVDSFFPYQMLWFLVSSPAQYEKVGKDWDKFASQPSGTGPFKLTKLVPRELAELSKNDGLLGQEADSESRQAGADPDAGGVDAHQRAVGRASRPDRNAGAGCGAATEIRRHADRRQHHAACVELSSQRVAGFAMDRHPAAQGAQSRDRPRRRGRIDEWPGQTRQRPGRSVEPLVRQADLRHQIRSRRSQETGQEAGYSKEKPLKATFIIAQGGTGQMLSLPMNEFLQQSFKEIGIDIDFKVVELETLYTAWRKGAADPSNAGITANNIAYVTSDPLYAIVRFFASDQVAPVGVNWGGYKNPKVDALINEAKQTFDPAKQDELIAQAHGLIVDDAAWCGWCTTPTRMRCRRK